MARKEQSRARLGTSRANSKPQAACLAAGAEVEPSKLQQPEGLQLQLQWCWYGPSRVDFTLSATLQGELCVPTQFCWSSEPF